MCEIQRNEYMYFETSHIDRFCVCLYLFVFVCVCVSLNLSLRKSKILVQSMFLVQGIFQLTIKHPRCC